MTAEAPKFIHLRVRTALSLLQSMIRPKDLAKWAAATDTPAVGVTDDNLFAALELAEALSDVGVQSITGLTLDVLEPGVTGERGKLAFIAQNEAGYRNLMTLSSESFLTPAGTGREVAFGRVLECAEGLICLTGGGDGLLNKRAAAGRLDEVRGRLKDLQGAFGDRLYGELQRHGRQEEAASEGMLVDLAYELGLPLVATNDVRFQKASQHSVHDVLLCIANSAYVSQADRPRASPQQYLKTPAEMAVTFADLPEALASTVEIARRCSYRPKKHKPILPPFDTKRGRNEAAELKAQAEAGLKERLKIVQPAAELSVYKERLEYEISIIERMGFPGYFLIVSDFIKWAKANDIPVGPGRGSGAGSLVAWVLTITDLDPIRFGLLFERFLNPERVSMPDFDVDFCQERRGEVIEYVREKYGNDRVSQIITFGTLQARAVLRDVGRVLQLPFGQVDKLAKLVPFNPAKPPTLAEAREMEPKLDEAIEAEEQVADLFNTAEQLEGLYRNASTHAAGIVIGDRPLVELVALYRDPKSDIPASQFNMKWAEAAGLVKFDFLGLKTLTVIDRAIKMIANKGVKVDLERLPLDDAKTYEMLQKGDVVGVFQVESQGMRRALVDMIPDRFEDLIVLVALYRPGPMANIPVYCSRKKGLEETTYYTGALTPWLKPILEPTFGIITYQEQVMQIARDMAGYSFGEADMLRRAMGKKIRAEMDKQRVRFMEGALAKGISEPDAELTFDACAKFADYGFNKSHSAPYALLTYQTAWLKANHPVEFLAASMSLDMGNTDKLAVFFQEARRMGVEVRLPDINESGADFTVEEGTVRYALGAIKGVGKPAMLSVEEARAKEGAFSDLQDFAERVDARLVNRRCFEALAKGGAFQSIEPNRAKAFASASMLSAVAAAAEEQRNSNQVSLFGDEPPQRLKLPEASAWGESERLDNELASVGFFLSGHPLDDLLTGAMRSRITLSAEKEVVGRDRQSLEMIGVVRARVEKPAKAGGKFAIVTLSDPSGEYELFVNDDLLQSSRDTLEVGQRVICKVRVRKVEEELRFSMDSVKELTKASIGNHEMLLVRLSADAPLERIAQVAATLQKGPSNGPRGAIRLEIPVDGDRVVTVELDGRFPVDFGTMQAFKSVPG
ncbi:MAG: DNA polymerase III subunit alpha, partial [Alphaproteobacteria bacterium 32-64-14]